MHAETDNAHIHTHTHTTNTTCVFFFFAGHVRLYTSYRAVYIENMRTVCSTFTHLRFSLLHLPFPLLHLNFYFAVATDSFLFCKLHVLYTYLIIIRGRAGGGTESENAEEIHLRFCALIEMQTFE